MELLQPDGKTQICFTIKICDLGSGVKFVKRKLDTVLYYIVPGGDAWGQRGRFMPAVWDHFQDCKHGERDTSRSPALKGGSFEMLEPVGVPFAPQCPHPPLPPRLLSSPCFLLSWLDSFDRFTTLGSKFFDSSR